MMVKLEDICSSIVDGDHQAPPKSSSGIPFVTISNIDEPAGCFNFESTSYVPFEYYERLSQNRRPRIGDNLYSAVGSFGIPVLTKQDKAFVFQRHIAILRPNEKVIPDYLFYVMKSRDFYHWADGIAIGAAQRTVTLGQLRNKEIDIPSLEIQRRIAGILSAYDKLIENNRKQIKLLEEAAQRLYKEWFIDLNFPSHETTPIDPTTNLPEGWVQVNFLQAIDYLRGRSYSAENLTSTGSKNLVNLNNIKAWGGWADGAEKSYEGACKDEQIVVPGDIIMAVTDKTKERRLVGHAARVPEYLDNGLISMDLVKLIPKLVTPEYLYSMLRYSGIAEMIALLANGTNVLHLKPDALNRVEVLVPAANIQGLVSTHLKPMFAKQDALEKHIQEAREARDRLLPKLMSGEMEV